MAGFAAASRARGSSSTRRAGHGADARYRHRAGHPRLAHPNATAQTPGGWRRSRSRPGAAGGRQSLHLRDKPCCTLALWGLMLAGVEQCSRAGTDLTRLGDRRNAPPPPPSSQPRPSGFVDLLSRPARPTSTIPVCRRGRPVETRVSVRTTARADAVVICAFGGGGPRRRSGCTVDRGSRRRATGSWPRAERELTRGDVRGR